MKSLRIPLIACSAAAVLLSAAPDCPAADPAPKDAAETIGARFDPVKQNLEGWTVWVEPSLLAGGAHAEEGAKALRMLADHLNRISILVEGEPLANLRKMEIWIEHEHPELKAMQYHPAVTWLVGRGYDARLGKKVHIPVARHLIERGQLFKHPAVVLHELAHAYHDQILDFGYQQVIDAYEAAVDSKSYEQVLLYNGRKVRHYGLTNHKEYFAEATEAYFYRNDFYPFVRGELKEHDPKMHAVLEAVWGKAG